MILVLAGIAWGLGLGKTSIGDAASAMQIAGDALSGFEATRALVGSDGRAAIVYGTDDRVALIKLHGARPAVRLVRLSAIAETAEGWVADPGARLFGRVTVKK